MNRLLKDIPLRSEYPRPQFVRKNDWFNLNGDWDFIFDDDNKGLQQKWFLLENSTRIEKRITVPFCFQSELDR